MEIDSDTEQNSGDWRLEIDVDTEQNSGDWRLEIDADTEQNSGDWRLEIAISCFGNGAQKVEIGDWRSIVEIGDRIVEIGDWRLQIGPLLSSKDMASSTVDGVSPSFRSDVMYTL